MNLPADPLVIETARDPGPGSRATEIVERKGLGHPDTICDALAEEFSLALCRFHLERFGGILHHNVDKVLLVGGSSAPRFGGGEIRTPIHVYLSGRAASEHRGVAIPVRELAEHAAVAWLRQQLPELEPQRHLRLHLLVRPGSADLTGLFAAGTGVPLANDTSCGTGFAPPSPLERAVLAVEAALQDDRRQGRRPYAGADVKVLGLRSAREHRLIVAVAMIGAHLRDLDAYRQGIAALTERVRSVAAPLLDGPLSVAVNAADDLARGRCYLTVLGTSAEAGDDGEAGRGNRVGGLITPGRPMTMESVAGKNPISHVGKLYNVLAQQLAQDVAAQSPELASVECLLASQIGAPIDRPQLACVRAHRADGRDLGALAPAIAAVARARIATAPGLWRGLLERRFRLFE